MKVSTLLLVAFTAAAQADDVLYLNDLTCDESYPVTVSDVSFSCEDGCSFGSTGNLDTSLLYSNLGVEDLYTTAVMNFTAFTNQSAYTTQVTDAGFSQQMFFGSMSDLCGNYDDDAACSLDDGNYSASFEYSIPSAGDLNDYFAGYNVQSSIKIYDYYNNMGVLGECTAFFTTDAPVEATTFQKVSSSTAYFLAAAAAALAIVYLVPRNNNTMDEKTVDLLNKTFSDDNDPDVIERERSVFKGLGKPSYDGGYGFDPEGLSPVHEENVCEKSDVSEQIVTEEIPWPSKENTDFDVPDAPISEITQDITDVVPEVEKIPSKEEVVAIVENTNSNEAP